MTTVAYDGTNVAADGRILDKTFISSDRTNKFFPFTQGRYKGGYMVGGGTFAEIKRLHAFYNEEIDKECKMKESEAYLVYNHKVYYIDSHLAPILVTPPDAIGSGGRVAIIAMDNGMSAKDAVREAMKYDCATGGKIRVITV